MPSALDAHAVNLTRASVRNRVRQQALRRRTHRLALLTVFRAAGETGLTYEEAADVLDWTHTRKCWWRRCGELRDDGHIERHATPQTRRSPQGPECAVYVIAPAGLAALDALDNPPTGGHP